MTMPSGSRIFFFNDTATTEIYTDPRKIDLDSEPGGLSDFPDRVSDTALGRVVHRPHTATPDAGGSRRKGIVDRAHGLKERAGLLRHVRANLALHQVWERVRKNGRRLESGRLRHQEMIPRARHVGGDPAILWRDGEERRSADHRVCAALVAAGMARYDCGAVLLRFAIDNLEHRLDFGVFDVHRQIPVHRNVL